MQKRVAELDVKRKHCEQQRGKECERQEELRNHIDSLTMYEFSFYYFD